MIASTSLPDISVVEARGRMWSTPARSSSSTSTSTSTVTPSRPSIPHSTSSPALSTPSSPACQSPTTPNRHAKNYHPYLIQSTASSLLTRSNSSPAPPPVFTGHRSSRSLSSFEYAGVGSAEKEEERRKSLDAPGSPSPMNRIGRGRGRGTAPPSSESKGISQAHQGVELSSNPKMWTPSELAMYLSQTLRNGGEDGSGHRLPALLVEDIKSWVLRHQVTGRAFIRGNSEAWGNSSRPPPFLTLLQSISRKLRRATMQGDLPDSLDEAGSVLLETDEEEDLHPLTGVKRMANAIEKRTGHLSDTSGTDVDEVPKIRAQLTGGSEGWERWGVKRHRSGSRSNAEDSRDLVPSSPEEVLVTPMIEQAETVDVDVAEESEDEGAGGTIKVPPPGLTASRSLSPGNGLSGHLPGQAHKSRLGVQRTGSSEGTPKAGTEDGREITPTPDNLRPTTTGLGFSPPEVSQENGSPKSKSAASSRYSSLRSKGRIPSARNPVGDGYTTSDEATEQRRVTIKPTPAALSSLFDTRSEREKELETELAKVMDRVKVLEEKLQASRSVTPITGIGEFVDVILGRKGDDGFPRRVGELPGYLFLVGFGVGAVMMRVLFGRAR